MTRKKTIIAAIALVALLSVGVVSAHFGGGWGAADDICTDDQTVGDCREAIQAAHEAERLARCTEQYDAGFCQALQDLHDEQRTESDALFEEYGIDGHPDVRPERPSERPTFDENTTEDERHAAMEADREAAFDAACVDAYGQEFCDAWSDLKDEHKAEVEQLFADNGYEMPDGPPGPGGHGGPGHEGGPRGRHGGPGGHAPRGF